MAQRWTADGGVRVYDKAARVEEKRNTITESQLH